VAKARVFIGSSVEGLEIAFAIQQNLEHDTEPTVWPQGAFIPSTYVLLALEQAADSYDFGVFVFSPDDLVTIRNEDFATVRDNVLFEFGLFIGRLGRERNFIVMPRGQRDFHLPADLLGLITTDFDASREDKNLVAATGPAAHRIRNEIKRLGFRKKPTYEEAIVSRAMQAAEYVSPRGPKVSDDTVKQLDEITDRFSSITKAVKGAEKAEESFDRALSVLIGAIKEVLRHIGPRGLRAGGNMNRYDAVLEWTKLPVCTEGPDIKLRAGQRDLPGMVSTVGDSQSITSPFPEHEGEWVVSYRCIRCHDGTLIYAIGHHIYAENYKEKPWVRTAKTHVEASDFLDIARGLAESFLDQMPTYYERFNVAISDASGK
jgi:hypothetical protein